VVSVLRNSGLATVFHPEGLQCQGVRPATGNKIELFIPDETITFVI